MIATDAWCILKCWTRPKKFAYCFHLSMDSMYFYIFYVFLCILFLLIVIIVLLLLPEKLFFPKTHTRAARTYAFRSTTRFPTSEKFLRYDFVCGSTVKRQNAKGKKTLLEMNFNYPSSRAPHVYNNCWFTVNRIVMNSEKGVSK